MRGWQVVGKKVVVEEAEMTVPVLITRPLTDNK